MNTIFLPKPSAALSALKGQDANSGLSRFQPQRGRAHSSLKSPCVPVDRSSGGSVRTAPQPSLAATAARLGHSLVSSDGSYVTHFPAAACAAPGYCFNTVVFISVYVSGALWSLSLLHGGNLASVCSLSFMGTPTHSSPWASPSRSEKHHLQAGDGGVCAVTTTDHGCGRWQSVL